jgi:hypothetical protein
MGVYLSTPNTDLHSETGQGYGVEYALGEIQVWPRTSPLISAFPSLLNSHRVGSRAGENIWKMHTSAVQILFLFMKQRWMVIMFVSLGSLMDTEVSQSVSSSPRPSHREGSLIGKEVAKFCQVYFLRELTQIDHFRERQFDLALKRCFHRMDEMIEDSVSLLFFVSFSVLSRVCCLSPHPSLLPALFLVHSLSSFSLCLDPDWVLGV